MKIVRSPSRFLCEVCSSSRSTNQLIYPFYCFKGSFDRFEFNFQNFRGCVSLFSYQGPFRFRNSLFLPQQQLVHSIITFCACQELFSKVFSVFILLRPIISDLLWKLRNRSLSLPDFSSSANFYILSQFSDFVKNFLK